jgi:hypothetical protein
MGFATTKGLSATHQLQRPAEVAYDRAEAAEDMHQPRVGEDEEKSEGHEHVSADLPPKISAIDCEMVRA